MAWTRPQSVSFLAACTAPLDLPHHRWVNTDITCNGHAANKAMTIAADVCIYTNHNFTTERIDYGTNPEL